MVAKRSRRFQYSLRACALLTLAVAVVFAWLAHQDATRRQIIADIEQAGGSVRYDNSFYSPFRSSRVSYVTLPFDKQGDVKMSRLQAFEHLSELVLTELRVYEEYGVLHREFNKTHLYDSLGLDCWLGRCNDDDCVICESKSEAISLTEPKANF